MGKLEKGGGVNWDATSHQQLWEWFSQPQLVELEGWMDSLNQKVAAHFQAAADKVDQTLRAAGVHWEGGAADAMREASTPLGEHALRAKDAATAAGVTTLGQFMHAKNMARSIPEPQPAPDQNIFLEAQSGNIAQYFEDVAEHERAANEAEARARDLARSYDAAADDAATSLPRFEPAPAATVSRAEPGDVINVEGPDPRREAGPGGPGDPGQTGPGPGSAPPPGSGTPPQGNQPDGITSGQSFTPQQSSQAGTQTPTPGTGDTQRPTTAGPEIGGPGGGQSGQPRGSTGGLPRGTTGGPGATGGKTPAGPGSGVRGGPMSEAPIPTRTAATAQGRGPASTGLAPVGTGRSKDEDGTDHPTPEYLRDYHDDFWDDTPPVAPSVIGDEDDD